MIKLPKLFELNKINTKLALELLSSECFDQMSKLNFQHHQDYTTVAMTNVCK